MSLIKAIAREILGDEENVHSLKMRIDSLEFYNNGLETTLDNYKKMALSQMMGNKAANRGIKNLVKKVERLKIYKEAYLAIKELTLAIEAEGKDSVPKDHILNIVSAVDPHFRDKERKKAEALAKKEAAEEDIGGGSSSIESGGRPDTTHWDKTAAACAAGADD